MLTEAEMGRCEDLTNFIKDQNVMARGLGWSISETARFVGAPGQQEVPSMNWQQGVRCWGLLMHEGNKGWHWSEPTQSQQLLEMGGTGWGCMLVKAPMLILPTVRFHCRFSGLWGGFKLSLYVVQVLVFSMWDFSSLAQIAQTESWSHGPRFKSNFSVGWRLFNSTWGCVMMAYRGGNVCGIVVPYMCHL